MKFKLFGLAILSTLYACSGNQKPVDMTNPPKKTDKNSTASLGNVTEKELSGYVRLPGQLKPFEAVNIFPKVNAFIKNILVDRGSMVKQGQVMIILQAPEMESQVQSATSRYLQAQETATASKDKFQRLKQAAAVPGSVSPLDLDNAKSKMKADQSIASAEKSNVSSVQTMKSYLTIRAPFDGIITIRNVNPGALVGPTNAVPLVVLQSIKKLRLEVFIPETYVDKVDLNQPVSFLFNALPGKTMKGRISRSANSLGSMRSEAIEIDVDNPSMNLKPGMYGEVKIPLLSGSKSLLVPDNAIVTSTERQYVVTVQNGKAKFIDIKEGMSANDSTEVFGDLKPKEKILLNATDNVKEGDMLK